MREVTRTALTPYSPAQMFVLVDDIERYPEFLPWVSAAQVLERGDGHVVGRLEMHRAGIRERFTTRNLLRPPNEITLDLVSGPFRMLQGRWSFSDVGGRGSRVDLRVRFEFANPVLAMLLSRSFEKSCSELVDAFVSRARNVYGRPAPDGDFAQGAGS
ncbi:MAG TPA: type II toxin-antitoxin system RatA family toxin [Steroidobacter sp.]|jgi:ribosome-associated toxin RatA of RatAB toxin-antitoxin module|nr:type II toxin-antitoxin system RatA family toxin [Steroidobacteraceae bacterium]HLS80262.1 type II toxin-antitoxin system RatA family toxin [Steroidobacter sp.]